MNAPSGGEVRVSGDLQAVADLIRDNSKFLLTTHEGPDGDALGSLLGMHHLLETLGRDSVPFLAAKEFPLPVEYRHIRLDGVFHEPPADLRDRVVIFLDCGNIDRMPVDFLKSGGRLVVNIDHHHDNTEFGDVNFVNSGASCTAEIVYELARLLDVRISPELARSLYIGIVTDTGKFMYDATTAHTHRVAADLIEAGVEVDDVNRRLYESMPLEKLRLLSRAISKIEILAGGDLVISYLTEADYREAGAGEEMTEGIIDHLRSIEGVRVAAMVRDQVSRGHARRKVSLRAADDRTDVSAVARFFGGGGHVRAAGCSTDLEIDEFTAEVVRLIAEQAAGDER
ncbi:MAG: bifunctional oligoribonuclease/PAP phosphatase NrnA [Solirubrobacterales bacterium]|nr:bifunctional oligoribonuclease/PAP phosphatase NrnA [Solirubrobacterales bacterium]